jgi:hypothetical protein
VTPEHAKTPPASETHHTTTEKPKKNVTPQKIAIKPTHSKIKTKAISQPTPLDGKPTFKANGT